MHKNSRNLGTILEFLAPEGWHEASSIHRIHKH